jgi:hypothetical protein|tara:strand:- start:443 stop:745 length:303 start_codon:yes stop_codon:yes gene_type:complete
MAWKTVNVRTIPNSDTAFEGISAEVLAYIKTNYVDTGKRISFSVDSSDDGLVLTYTSVFLDESAKNEVVNDSTISTESARRNKVNADNGITKELTFSGEV